MPIRTFHRRHRKGNAAFVVLSTLVLLGFASLAVDIGNARMVKAQLQVATDAASHGAVAYLDGTTAGIDAARDKALEIAAANYADGRSVTVDPNLTNDANGDVVFGIYDYDDGDFEVADLGDDNDVEDTNAIRVRASRNDVGIVFGFVNSFSALSAGAQAMAVRGRRGGAGESDCVFPLMLPACLFDDVLEDDEDGDGNPMDPAEATALNLTDLKLNPAGEDAMGWGSWTGINPSDFDLMLADMADGNCDIDWPSVAVGDTVDLDNGVHMDAYATVPTAMASSPTYWDDAKWGSATMHTGSYFETNPGWGHTLEGTMLLFDAGPEYCESGGGGWTEDATVVAFAHAAIYDIRTANTGPNPRNMWLRLELLNEYEVGTSDGGPDYGVVWEEENKIVQ